MLNNCRFLISAGPTHEAIDPVRFIGNRASGKMGIALVDAALNLGAQVTLVLGPTHLEVQQHPRLDIIRVTSAQEMFEAIDAHFEACDILIKAAAVADYRPKTVAKQKMKKKTDALHIELEPTIDILKTMGAKKQAHQCLVGFALETHNEEEFAKQKLAKKNLDLVVMNSLQDSGAGFSHNTNKIYIFDKNGNSWSSDLKQKSEIAVDIINYLENYWNENFA